MESSASSYREFAPGLALRPFVECFWHASADAELPRETMILPDGSADLILTFHRGRFHGIRAVGAMTRPLLSRMPPGESMLGVRFRPGGAYPFFDLPLKEMTDRIVDARESSGSFPASLAGHWAAEELHEAIPRGDLLQAVRRLLLAGMKRNACVEPRIAAAVAVIEGDIAGASVTALSEHLNLSRQHLKRLFDKHTGLGPAKFIRVVRLQSLLSALSRLPGEAEPDWADLAPGFGWYDQAHLINDFRELTGSTPGFHFSNTRSPSSAIIEA